ncbi:protein-L-isoaspartate O-methyltransferase family protein [Afipia birgiae]|jgi:protein-L-isoaspartate(D-aspartate) O-methyltransferase|uniref:protein-L-isoaspartate O-methyltransferase family protein n=1 Tax=Afipia birgiae TaxID=151414 RepID=UPI00031EC02D|nr:protein-L-isoaspartate O-methyltransferase [Afipia birgiae]MBX9822027.1 protein-L-isoaspartate O-methyltransferase [Afipia birgiae]
MSDFTASRQNMVDCQVRPSDVTDLRIIDAMLAVPRETFVPDGKRAIAYLDLDIDVAADGQPKRHLIKPAVLAKMLQAAAISETDRVLVVGCASGYSAAVLSHLAAEVFATEPDPSLAAAAKKNLAGLGLANATVTAAAPAEGDRAHAPYDVIVMDGATEVEPQGLYEQLKMGGRLVGVFATRTPPRATLVARSPSDFGNRVLFDASAPVLTGLERRPAFTF